jgi:hypothetical protein
MTVSTILPPQAGPSSPADPHLEVAPEQPDRPPPIPLGQRVGYAFDPIPSAIRSDPRLKPIDHQVLAILLSFAIWRRDSCWTSMKIIAARIRAIRPGRSGKFIACERTVQRSIERLKAAGYIRHERVSKPDLDDPSNFTGWRFYFNFVPVPDPAVEPPREVTKEPREVTKDTDPGEFIPVPGAIVSIDPARFTPIPGPREVTPKSGDSLVTQIRGEVREREKSTLERSTELARAGEGDGGTTTAKGHPAATGGHPPAPVWTPWELAEKFFKRMRDRGLILKAALDGDNQEVIQANPLGGSPPIQPDEIAELKGLRPQLLDFLNRRPDPSRSAPGSGVEQGRTVRGVPNTVKTPVRSLIGKLAGNPDPAIEATFCRAIAEALGDHNPESLGLFLGLAGDVRRGELAEACLQEAFKAACGRGVKNRGSMFTAMVKRWKKATHHPSRGTP